MRSPVECCATLYRTTILRVLFLSLSIVFKSDQIIKSLASDIVPHQNPISVRAANPLIRSIRPLFILYSFLEGDRHINK